MSAAFKKMEAAIEAQRKFWYGDQWRKVDWYGIPNRDLPEEERQTILADQRKRRNEDFDRRHP